jgi:PAS domain S-box-containing protein
VGELREDQSLEALLSFLKAKNGCDFSGYKRSSLRRRIEKRMRTLDVRGFEHYCAFLEANPTELVPLFNAIVINVSAFFRDPPVWAFLDDQVIPRVLDARPATSSIRIWSAGCAGGQEPYTIAMVLAERMGIDDYCRRVKIYATDLDQEALDRARVARYDAHALESVPEALRIKYFQNDEDGFVFHGALRRSVIFGRHDLVMDRPVSHVDLLFCRNTLMYFNVNAQTRVLSRFRDALNEAGFLIIGRAEMLFSPQRLFVPVDIQQGVYFRLETELDSEPPPPPDSALVPASGELLAVVQELETAKEKLAALGAELAFAHQALDRCRGQIDTARSLLASILGGVPFGICVVDTELMVRLWNDRAAEMWGVAPEAAVGRSLLELGLEFPVAELEATMRACARGEGNRYVTVEAAGRDGRTFRCHVTVTELRHDQGVQWGAIVVTTEPTQSRAPWT